MPKSRPLASSRGTYSEDLPRQHDSATSARVRHAGVRAVGDPRFVFVPVLEGQQAFFEARPMTLSCARPSPIGARRLGGLLAPPFSGPVNAQSTRSLGSPAPSRPRGCSARASRQGRRVLQVPAAALLGPAARGPISVLNAVSKGDRSNRAGCCGCDRQGAGHGSGAQEYRRAGERPQL